MTVENAKQLFDETVCPTTKTKCWHGDQSVWKTSDDFSNKLEHYLSTHVPEVTLHDWVVGLLLSIKRRNVYYVIIDLLRRDIIKKDVCKTIRKSSLVDGV